MHELVWPAGDSTPWPLRWAVPVNWLIPAGSGQFELGRGWVVELVGSGLWIRPTDRTGGAGTVRTLPPESARCTVVVGAADTGRLRPPWRKITRLLRDLPADARRRLVVAVPRGAGGRLSRAAARWSAAELGG